MSRPPGTERITRTLFLASAAPGLIAASILATLSPRYWMAFGVLLAVTLVAYAASLAGRRNGKWLLPLFVVNLLIVTPESWLRVAGFRYEPGVEFAYPRSFQGLEPDPHLFWTLRKHRPEVNEFGFLGPEIETPKPAGITRVLFLGDSVVAQGYADEVVPRMRERRADLDIQGVTMALAGYSSHQGRKIVELYGDVVEPDVVIVSYGWNDHWLARGRIDSEKTIATRDSPLSRIHDAFYFRSRMLQALRYLLVSEPPLSVVRVAADEYVDNLEFIGDYFERRGVPVYFLTPPSSHERLGVPDYLVRGGFAESKQDVLDRHAEYNRRLRRLASRRRWRIVELDESIGARDDLDRIFMEDGIHLTPYGLAQVGKVIADELQEFSDAVPRSRP